MWNVEAIRQWANAAHEPNSSERPAWWSQAIDRESRGKNSSHNKPFDDGYIGEFIGQGRQIGFNGLPHAVLQSVYDGRGDTYETELEKITKEIEEHLKGPRPGSWWMLSFVSLALVWLELGMAFVVSYNIPTVGLGCRATSYLIYGGMSTLPWLIHLLPGFARPGKYRKAFCHFLCLLSTLTLFFITFAAVSIGLPTHQNKID
jgi:hypothetical protein